MAVNVPNLAKEINLPIQETWYLKFQKTTDKKKILEAAIEK